MPSGMLITTFESRALLSKVVMSIPLGITYALWSGIGTVAIVLVGRFAYQQTMEASIVC